MQNLSELSDEKLLQNFGYEYYMVYKLTNEGIKFGEALTHHFKNYDYYKKEILKRMNQNKDGQGEWNRLRCTMS